jgi:predicted ATPase
MALVGRQSELQALEKLLDAATAGLSGVLVLRGEAGFGKTALLDAAAEAAAARSIQIARLTGVESETQLSYAALHRLLLPYADRVELLPGPQRDALRCTFGLLEGPADRFMVALGVLTLLAEVALEKPLVCLIDDGHWLDPETQTVLGFVAQRLDAERVAMVMATREMESSAPSGALPDLAIRGLSDAEAKDLLDSVSPARLSPYVVELLIASTSGNPLALIELTKELTPEQLSGVSPLPEPIPVGHSLELIFSRQLNRLPPESRLLVALAAGPPASEELARRSETLSF